MIEMNSINNTYSTKKKRLGLISFISNIRSEKFSQKTRKRSRQFTCSWLNEELDSASIAVANKVAQLHCIIQNCLSNSMIVEFSQSSKLQKNFVIN
jgi:hypothetical protein